MNPFLAVISKKRATGGGGGGTPYYRSLTVDSTKVPDTQTNFPVMVSLTDATLKTIANGGHVNRSDGFDIGFYSDSGLTTKLKWEMESYSATAGTVVAWVKIASLSSSADTVFYMGYGDTTIATDQSDKVSTWSNSFIGVYHLGDGTTLSVADSLAANNGTNNGATATSGQCGGGAAFVAASSQYIALPAGVTPTTSCTYSAWIKATSFPNSFNATIVRTNSTIYGGMWVKADGHSAPFFTTLGGSSGLTGSVTMVAGTWYYYVLACNTTDMEEYINGVSDGNNGLAGGGINTTSLATRIGGDSSSGSFFWNGSIDEVRIASARRTVDWIVTEYNNQSAPGTFMIMGSETPA